MPEKLNNCFQKKRIHRPFWNKITSPRSCGVSGLIIGGYSDNMLNCFQRSPLSYLFGLIVIVSLEQCTLRDPKHQKRAQNRCIIVHLLCIIITNVAVLMELCGCSVYSLF